jgi:tetratricopeptide (TPR) repeat protein
VADYDKEIADYSEAIRLNPAYSEVCGNRVATYGKKADFDKAIADCTETSQLNPKDAEEYSIAAVGPGARRTRRAAGGRSIAMNLSSGTR